MKQTFTFAKISCIHEKITIPHIINASLFFTLIQIFIHFALFIMYFWLRYEETKNCIHTFLILICARLVHFGDIVVPI
jgi:hypothetical protein